MLGRGDYDAEHGEVFPIVVPEGGQLIGWGTTSDMPAIRGAGPDPSGPYRRDQSVSAALILRDGAVVRGFSFEQEFAAQSYAVLVRDAAATVMENDFHSSDYGGVVLIRSSSTVSNNSFEDDLGRGIGHGHRFVHRA